MYVATRWVFTLNNPTKMDTHRLFTLFQDSCYLVFQKELSTTGTPHYQGYVEFALPVDLSSMKAIISPRIWCKPAFATRQQNHAYCTKTLTRTSGPWVK